MGFEIYGHEMHFYGLCKNCAKERFNSFQLFFQKHIINTDARISTIVGAGALSIKS